MAPGQFQHQIFVFNSTSDYCENNVKRVKYKLILAHIVGYIVVNMVRLTGQPLINLLITLLKSNESVYSLWTWSSKRLFSLFCVIVLLKYVLTRRKALKERSDVAFVAGITKISLRSKPTCINRSLWAVDNFAKYPLMSKIVGAVGFSLSGILWKLHIWHHD